MKQTRKTPTSTMCEQTASFALMNSLSSILKPLSSQIIPINFWVTREGSNISKEFDDGKLLRLLGFYPRRPKVFSTEDELINVKVNSDIQKTISYANNIDVPIIIGVPLVKSVLDYSLSSPCSWFSFSTQTNDFEDFSFQINIKREIQRPLDGKNSVFSINKKEILDLAKSIEPKHSWISLIEKMQEIKRNNNSFPFWAGAFYKPFYIVF